MAHRWSIIVATAAIAVTAGCGSSSNGGGSSTKPTTPEQQGGVRQALVTMSSGYDAYKEVIAQCQKAVEQNHQKPGYCQGGAISSSLRQRGASVSTFLYQLKKVHNAGGIVQQMVDDTVTALNGYVQSLNVWANCAQAIGTQQYFQGSGSPCDAKATAADLANGRLQALVPRWQRYDP